ncbi:hypothetical protein SAMN04488074_11630 [Lentzea albidocapillata subsp. violacea]|uniref:Uncharacterized protein n=1 Tax=Lentzea albidocapillata subsp. violacea TaxID=128104 RepID=A0A1G9Q515_9PSEU|nr:hypothetical protein [Lentzea albidocapillata]SDM06086.1 hypothetical protein SAMN04488074_11630 [Lentzea albidocapillata subsp. violacea]
MACRISTASVKLRLDINFGDPVTAAPQLLDLPSQRPGSAPVSVIGDLAELRQQTYSAFKRRLGPDGAHLPDSFGDVVAAVIEFVDPLAAADLCEASDPEARKWVWHSITR